jgi:hypothetical protein
MDEVQANFFNFDLPCPNEVVNCENIRAEYKSELDKYKAQGACNSCIERSLRNKYITIILSSVPK